MLHPYARFAANHQISEEAELLFFRGYSATSKAKLIAADTWNLRFVVSSGAGSRQLFRPGLGFSIARMSASLPRRIAVTRQGPF
jgi:hypothetical protein